MSYFPRMRTIPIGLAALALTVVACAPVPAPPAVKPAVLQPPPPAPAASMRAAQLTLDSIFGSDHLASTVTGAGNLRTLVVAGDIIPARVTNTMAVALDKFDWALDRVATTLKHAGDLRFADLEAPLVANCPTTSHGLRFCGDPRWAPALAAAGIHVVSLENNHSTDGGWAALQATERLLTQNGIAWVRRDHPVIVDVRGLRFGLLAWNGVGTAVDEAQLRAAVAALHERVDVTVVMFHWGREYTALPEPAPGLAPDDPRSLGHAAVEAGADLVVGNHPHTPQGLEFYRGKAIVYAHGNFVFDQMWSWQTQVGVIGRYTFAGKRLVDIQFLPIRIADYGQPYLLQGEEAALVLDRMRRASEVIAQGGSWSAARALGPVTTLTPAAAIVNPAFAVRWPTLPGWDLASAAGRSGLGGLGWVQMIYRRPSGQVLRLTQYPKGLLPSLPCRQRLPVKDGTACVVFADGKGFRAWRELVDDIMAVVDAPTQAQALLALNAIR